MGLYPLVESLGQDMSNVESKIGLMDHTTEQRSDLWAFIHPSDIITATHVSHDSHSL